MAPPLDVSMAHFVGWKPRAPVNPESAKGDLGELIAMFGETGGVIN